MPGPEASPSGSVQVGSKMHGGQEWDFVFDVDVEDGQPVKRLPYNRHENPYDAADRCRLLVTAAGSSAVTLQECILAGTCHCRQVSIAQAHLAVYQHGKPFRDCYA